MAIIIGTNSWCTIVYSNTYFSEKWNTSDWATLTDNQKTQLLIHAYRWINQQSSLSISPAETEDIVKQAQCELAWYIYNYMPEHEKRRSLYIQGVTQFRISAFSESLKGAEFPGFILDMLEDYLTSVGGKFPYIEREY